MLFIIYQLFLFELRSVLTIYINIKKYYDLNTILCTERSFRMSRMSIVRFIKDTILSVESKNLHNVDCSQDNYLQDQHITIGYIE